MNNKIAPGTYDVAMVGAGMASLTAAALLARAGHRVVCAELGTPITFRRYGMSTLGTVYGLPPPFGHHAARTPINGLYLAGSANLGPGVEAVVLSGIAAAEAIHGAPLL